MVLLALKSTSHVSAQLLIVFKSAFNMLAATGGESTTIYRLVSSANNVTHNIINIQQK